LNKTEKKEVRNIVKSTIKRQAEPCRLIYAPGAIQVDLNGFVFKPTVPAPGLGDDFRKGDQVFLNYYKLALTTYIGTVAGVRVSSSLRCIVFLWKEDTSVYAPVPADILSSTTVGTLNAVNSMYNHDKRKQYTILADKVFRLDSAGSDVVGFRKTMKINKKMYLNNASTLGNNQVFILLISDTLAVSAPITSMSGEYNYTDM